MFWSMHLLLLIATFSLDNVFASPAQAPFQVQDSKPKKLHGRFLHITDMHPDPYYTYHAAESTACHRKKSKKKKNVAPLYGYPFSECDSPFKLTNFTLDYLKDNWADDIDFVVWTGDNARHDNDRKIPRTPAEIYDLNRAIAAKMHKVFTSRGIPVVPSLGNNDVWPHNILSPGPNSITNEFSSIWKSFIPFPNLQVFQRGAYYSVEVIPDAVAVISLNTMYFYDSNKVVAGCPYKQPSDPGNLQFDWLKVQLEMYRNRGMQVWISGHVPPSAGNYFPECYVRYVDLALRYQDTILGHLFGHMNVDHFFFLEADDLEIFPEKDALGVKPKGTDDGDLFSTLVENWSNLPKSPNLTEYAVVNVGPSVVPNPYVPSFRVFSYNVSASDEGRGLKRKKPKKPSKRKPHHPRGDRGDKKEYCKREEYRDTWRCHLDGPWHDDANSPSQSNQQWTPLGYAQYYIPKLKKANKTHAPRFELEYLTYGLESLHPEGGGTVQYPVPLGQLPESLRDGGTSKSKYAPYSMEDLTVGSWIRLAREIGRSGGKKVGKRFRKYMYFGGDERR